MAYENEFRQDLHIPRSMEHSGNEDPTLKVFTEGEIERRVRSVIDKAIDDLDLKCIRELKMVYEAVGTVSAASVVFNRDDPDELATLRNWIRQRFGDCSGEPLLYLVCTDTATPQAISEHQNRFAIACTIPMTQIARPIYLPRENTRGDTASISVQLKFNSRALAQIIVALRDHFKHKAIEHFQLHPSDEKVPVRLRVGLWLSWLLEQGDKPVPPRPLQNHEATKNDEAVKDQTKLDLSPDITQALCNRVALYRRRLANQHQGNNQSEEFRMQEAFRRALEGGDPMDVAAVACLMWDVGYKLASQTPVKSTPDKELPTIAVEKPGKAAPTLPQAEVLLTTDELSKLIRYDVRTIRETLVGTVLLEGVHFVRPFGGRKILFRWVKIAETLGIETEVVANGQ